MAGGGAPTPAKGGKKSVDFTVNLIPMIDFLSVLISFLLLTAVWTQLARINADQAVSQNMSTPPDNPEKIKNVNILLTANECIMNVSGEKPPTRIARSPEDRYLKDLRRTFNEAKQRVDKSTAKVMLAAEDTVPYKNIIQVMDVSIDIGLTGVTVSNPTVVQGELL
jgi:biopolymer transport protein TolR